MTKLVVIDRIKVVNDQKVINPLHWFVNEQIEEDKFSIIVVRVERIEDSYEAKEAKFLIIYKRWTSLFF